MKKTETTVSPVSLQEVIGKLEAMFNIFNAKSYDGKLDAPVITVSPEHKNGILGWCTGWKAWKNGAEGGYYEINLCSEYLSCPFAEIAETLVLLQRLDRTSRRKSAKWRGVRGIHPNRQRGGQNHIGHGRCPCTTVMYMLQRQECARLACERDEAFAHHIAALSAYEGITPEQFCNKYGNMKEAA